MIFLFTFLMENRYFPIKIKNHRRAGKKTTLVRFFGLDFDSSGHLKEILILLIHYQGNDKQTPIEKL